MAPVIATGLYRASVNLVVKVLDFVQCGGPWWLSLPAGSEWDRAPPVKGEYGQCAYPHVYIYANGINRRQDVHYRFGYWRSSRTFHTALILASSDKLC